MKKFQLICSMVISFNLSYGQAGTLDNTFHYDGKVTTDIGGGLGSFGDYARSTVIQPDGKIILAGFADTGLNFDFALTRYNTDGTLDNTFGTNGIVTTTIGPSDDRGFSLAIQSDGKILLAGDFIANLYLDFALVRYNTDGTLDNTFGTNGIVTTPIGTTDDYVKSVAIQSDGKILVAGSSNIGTDLDFAMVRYNPDGTLDNLFDTDGKVTTDFGIHSDEAHSIAIQSNGKILLGGWAYTGSYFDFALARYNKDGSLDSTFGVNGKVTTAIGSGADKGYSLVIQNDNKILLGGYIKNIGSSTRDFAVVRYNIDGTLDNTFDADGKVTTDFGGFDDKLFSLSVGADGKIIGGGYSDPIFGGTGPEPAFFALVRYDSNGALDNTFGSNGKVTTAIGPYADVGYSLVIQPDEKVVLAGWSYNGANFDFALARYTYAPGACPPIIDLGMTVLSTGTSHAQNEVISSGTVPAGTDVSLKAGDVVKLKVGFNSAANANLEAIIEDCEARTPKDLIREFE